MARQVIYHVTYHKDENWVVKLEKTESVISSHKHKTAAVTMACQLAKANKPSQVKIHLENGTFESDVTYGKVFSPTQG